MPVPQLPDADRITQYTISIADDGPFSTGFDIYADGSDYENFLEVWLDDEQQSGNWTLTSPTGSLSSIPRPITDGKVTFTSAVVMILNEDTARQEHRAVGRFHLQALSRPECRSLQSEQRLEDARRPGALAPDFCRHVLCAPDWQ
jgi:hypothetical protein